MSAGSRRRERDMERSREEYMSRRIAQTILYPIAALITCAGTATAQDLPRPFTTVALMAGPFGFARPPINSGMIGTYAYVAVAGGLLGVQGGMSFLSPEHSRAVHALVTGGLPVFRGRMWQTYPYLGVGAGILRAGAGADDARVVYAAGLGFDLQASAGSPITLGSRVGYLTRSGGDDGSIAWVTVSLGIASR
jgi:hypothetical protein